MEVVAIAMKKLRVFLASFALTVYEVLLVMLAVDVADITTNIWQDLPLFQNNTEFILVLGQVPVAALLGWWYYRKKKELEKDFLSKYGKNNHR